MPKGVYKRMGDEELERIKSLIRSGYTKVQISDMTKRSTSTIQKIRDKMRKEESFDNYHVGGMISKGVPVAIVDNESKKPVVKSSSLKVDRRTIRFVGIDTKFMYNVWSDMDDLVIKDETGNQIFKVDFNNLESFVTELLEIAVEAENIKKSVM